MGLPDRDFKAALVKMTLQKTTNFLEIFEKQKSLAEKCVLKEPMEIIELSNTKVETKKFMVSGGNRIELMKVKTDPQHLF